MMLEQILARLQGQNDKVIALKQKQQAETMQFDAQYANGVIDGLGYAIRLIKKEVEERKLPSEI